ncbi:nucleotidyl transferase AbiEii/AbiGii toxin family protein [Candidatus Micrarchaeota archaeon]|nr:nucleotidyl transferase AbiEii/AbiGii toxin family protein [Candidatus Micrarchaeota archaeon]
MIELDLDEYRRLSGKWGLSLQFVQKEFKVMDALAQVAGLIQKEGLDAVFKGGTALNKVYLRDKQRFSEDLDFDEFSDESDSHRIAGLTELMKKIAGFKVEGPWRYYDTIRFECSYSRGDFLDHARIEFRLQKRKCTLNSIGLETAVSTIAAQSVANIPCYSLDDLVARKLLALAERTEGKDVWDAANSLEKTKNIIGALERALDAEGKKRTAGELIKQMVLELEKADAKRMQVSTNQFIPLTIRPRNWSDLIKTLQRQLEELTDK